jgi:hypothetical protein
MHKSMSGFVRYAFVGVLQKKIPESFLRIMTVMDMALGTNCNELMFYISAKLPWLYVEDDNQLFP